MTNLDVPSEEAEQSVAQIFRTVAAHKMSVTRLPLPPASARLGGPNRRAAELQEKRQATLIRIVSTAESFAAELLWRQVEAETRLPEDSLAAALTGGAVIDATMSWEKQKTAYKRWFRVEGYWTGVTNLADARNAAAHGLGQLTRQQLRTEAKITSHIRAMKISVTSRRIMLTEDNLDYAVSICRTFIEDLDRLVRTRKP